MEVETRADFQALAQVRLDEAKVLLDNGKWDGAYYLAGYAIELAFKACVIKRLMAWDHFPDKKFSAECYTHSLKALLDLAGLKADFSEAETDDPVLSGHWGIVKDWTEMSRYQRIDEARARNLYTAVADPSHGVYAWLRSCY